MGVIGFSGARLVSATARQRVLGTLVELYAEEFVTGAAPGIDALIGADLATRYPDARHTVIVPANRSQIDPWWLRLDRQPKWLEIVLMGEGSSYRARNERIVTRSTELRAYPAYPEHDERSRRSGTWQTIRLARQNAVPTTIHLLSVLAPVPPFLAGGGSSQPS